MITDISDHSNSYYCFLKSDNPICVIAVQRVSGIVECAFMCPKDLCNNSYWCGMTPQEECLDIFSMEICLRTL